MKQTDKKETEWKNKRTDNKWIMSSEGKWITKCNDNKGVMSIEESKMNNQIYSHNIRII